MDCGRPAKEGFRKRTIVTDRVALFANCQLMAIQMCIAQDEFTMTIKLLEHLLIDSHYQCEFDCCYR